MNALVHVADGQAATGPSTSHVSECEKSGQESIRLNAPADAVPICKCLLRLAHQIEDFAAREATRQIVIRFVTGPLKFDECARNSNELRLQCLAIQARGELSRHVVIRELLGDLSHYGMTERSRQTAAERGPVAAAKHALRRFIDQQVKEGVVGCRNRPAQARLQRPPRLLHGELSGLPQQVNMQTHDS